MKDLHRVSGTVTAMLFAAAAMAQPANDDCANAAPAALGDNPFNNFDATTDANPDCVYSGADVWFSFTPATTGSYVIDLCGSDFDTTLTTFADCGAAAGACNDDSCGLSSQLTVPGFAGITFFIRVAGFGGDVGSGIMHINAIESAQWDEILNGGADAGDSIATAQVPAGSGELHDIGGTLESGDTADIYRIVICDPGSFSATTAVAATGDQDTQLFLFDSAGNGVQMNDDDPTGAAGVNSRMDNAFVTTAGVYYIAVTHYDMDPTNAAGEQIWNDTPFDAVRAPDGDTNGGDIVLAGWDSFADTTFTYGIRMTGVCFPGCAADFNGDTVLDFFDYLDFVDAFSQNAPSSDFNHDAVIDFFDYLDFVDAFASGC